MNILVTGAAGLIGTALTSFLTKNKHRVIRLVRKTQPAPGEIGWNPSTQTLDTEALEGLDAVSSAIRARLAQMAPLEFELQIQQGERTFTVGWRFLFLHFHYTYHLGQLELLRQLAGHSEKIV